MKQRKEIDVHIILEFDDDAFGIKDDPAFEAIEMFLAKTPERYTDGRLRLTLYSASVIKGMVDEDGIPCKRAGRHFLPIRR